MKCLTHTLSLILFLTLGISNAWGLPRCPSDKSVLWTNCKGRVTLDSGDLYVGGWKNGQTYCTIIFIDKHGEN